MAWQRNQLLSDPVTRALLELSHTIGLHVVYGCILTMEAEMSSGNTDTGATEHVPSGIYGKFANAYSRILVSSNLKKKKKWGFLSLEIILSKLTCASFVRCLKWSLILEIMSL